MKTNRLYRILRIIYTTCLWKPDLFTLSFLIPWSSYIDDKMTDQPWDVTLCCKGEGKGLDAPLSLGEGVQPLNITSSEYRKLKVDEKSILISGTKVRVGTVGCTKVGLPWPGRLATFGDMRWRFFDQGFISVAITRGVARMSSAFPCCIFRINVLLAT